MRRPFTTLAVAGLMTAGACGCEDERSSEAGPHAFLGVSAEAPTGSAAIDPSGLVAAWDMSSLTVGGSLRDFGPNALHGAVGEEALLPSPFGRARSFEQVAAQVHVPENPVLDLDGPLTIATWVRVDRGGEHQHIVACDDKWALWVTPDDRYRLGDTRGGGVSTDPGRVEPGVWTALVAVLDGTRGSELDPGTVRIYVDGEEAQAGIHMRTEEASQRSTWEPGDLYPTDACYIGFESHQGNEAHQTMPFYGAVDELLIFDRPWTAAEAAAFSVAPSGVGP